MDPLRIIPLGGLGEIGMNLMVYEYEGAAIAVDCGMMFPDAATLGVDVIIPDMTYFFEQPAKLRAVILTQDRKSTRLNSSHSQISYAVFCLKKKKINNLLRFVYRRTHLPAITGQKDVPTLFVSPTLAAIDA